MRTCAPASTRSEHYDVFRLEGRPRRFGPISIPDAISSETRTLRRRQSAGTLPRIRSRRGQGRAPLRLASWISSPSTPNSYLPCKTGCRICRCRSAAAFPDLRREGRPQPECVLQHQGYLPPTATSPRPGSIRSSTTCPAPRKGADPSAAFDTIGYLAANPDVAAAGVNPLEHFWCSASMKGASRWRRAVPIAQSTRGAMLPQSGVGGCLSCVVTLVCA